jgi:hypothetical protein
MLEEHRCMAVRVAVIAALAMVATPLAAAERNPQIDFPAFVDMATTVQQFRRHRLLELREFQARAAQDNVLLLDARSAAAFDQGHIAGAINLPLPDFTASSLAAAIGPDRDRPILIYCNNNFINDAAPVVRKLAPLALNIQTMINLYGYGYRNVYELGGVFNFNAPLVHWVTSAQEQSD